MGELATELGRIGPIGLIIWGMKLGAKELRITKPTEEQLAALVKKPIYLILDNVLDTYNIGSLFRLADAIGAAEIILCGASETPPSSRIHKAAVGTEEWVKWRHFASASAAIAELRIKNNELWVIAVEQDSKSIPLSSLNLTLNLSPDSGERKPVAIVVGHETSGVSKEALDLADVIVEIPMYGVNKSLNVHVSASIVAYDLLRGV